MIWDCNIEILTLWSFDGLTIWIWWMRLLVWLFWTFKASYFICFTYFVRNWNLINFRWLHKWIQTSSQIWAGVVCCCCTMAFQGIVCWCPLNSFFWWVSPLHNWTGCTVGRCIRHWAGYTLGRYRGLIEGSIKGSIEGSIERLERRGANKSERYIGWSQFRVIWSNHTFAELLNVIIMHSKDL